jgi:type VI secretion system protein ImpC
MPRFLARLPYGAKTSPVDEFDFEEDTAGATQTKYSWANAAYAMAVNINRSFKTYGWCSRIRGIEIRRRGGEPAHAQLPVGRRRCRHEVPDGDRDLRPARGRAVEERLPVDDPPEELGLRRVHQRPVAAEASGVRRPRRDRQCGARGRLPYLFACNRFAHYLKCIVRDKVGSFRSRESMQNWLNEWILNYVDGDPSNSSEDTKAKRPLAAAQVEVEEIEGSPGYYQSKFYLKPHYQLEGLTVSLRLVSKLPSEKTA